MKTLTEQFIEAANGLLKLQPEVSDPTGHYQMFDDGAVTREDGEFLYGLVRILKPERVLTTGIYTGVSDMYIAQALKDNGFGHSTALEIEESHLRRAEKLWKMTGVSNQVTGVLQSSLEYPAEGIYDFIFLDSEPNLRFNEFVKLFPMLKEGGYIGIHDLPRGLCQGNINPDHPELKSWPYGDLPKEMVDWIKADKVRLFSLPTPRGITFFYKPSKDDFHV